MQNPIARSSATRKSVAGINNFFVDDLFGTGETEMEQRVLPRLRKDFQWCSEDRNDVTFTRQRIRWKKDLQSGSCIEVRRERPKELEEIPAERNTKENLYCTPAMRAKVQKPAKTVVAE